jgi:endonuclease G
MLVSLEQLKLESNLQAAADSKKKISPAEQQVITDNTTVKGKILGKDDNLEARKEMLDALSLEPGDFAYERAIGLNDSVYSNFAELIGMAKRKVARIVIIADNKKQGYGTGFMVAPGLMITNWHVFKTVEMAAESELHFFYEYDVQGRPSTPVVFKFDTARFYNNQAYDYCVIGVQSTDINNRVSLESIGYLYLDKTTGKIGDIGMEKLNIIHHPQGDYKQISIRENTFDGIDEYKIFYKTDTAPGSSGSPVFNDQWQVVGLHHKSVPKMDAKKENFLDKDDQIIPVVDKNKIDISRIVWVKNEGIRISVILKHLAENQPEFAAAIARVPSVQSYTFTPAEDTSTPENYSNMSKNININIPVSALSSDQTIDISLSSKKVVSAATVQINTTDNKAMAGMSELLQEKAKLEKELERDYSACKGYSPSFLGTSVALPKPHKSLLPQVALTKDKKSELKYFKYSVIFNAVRKMPIISAVNVEGDAAKRLDDSKRSDDWLRDNRIDLECQLNDAFYAKSGFDKGHMGRFEDANWDTTEKKAYRNGIYTCVHTNACPQVPGINRNGSNLWGKLERAILESGIKKESGKLAKMTVFNGPIFDDSKDRVRLGVTVPMQFYKIVLWLDDANKLKATGFKLSQETLVTDDQFDESLLLGEEALDIDKLVAYKEYQCSIKHLGQLTKIDFKHIEKYDTYKANAGEEETLLTDETSLVI